MNRIFCIANRFGFIFFLIFILMLLVGGTYQNNLVFMMAFLILALGLVTIIQTARNVRDIEILDYEIEADFVNSTTWARLVIKNRGKTDAHNLVVGFDTGRRRWWHLPWRSSFSAKDISVPAGSVRTAELTVQLPRQWGRHSFARVFLKSEYPYGLFITWKIFRIKKEFYAYPEAQGVVELPQDRSLVGEDFVGHRLYQVGDSFSRVDWKLFARERGLFTKDFTEAQSDRIEFDLEKLSQSPIEQSVQWILTSHNSRVEYGLRGSDFKIPPSHSPSHYHRVMQKIVDHYTEVQ